VGPTVGAIEGRIVGSGDGCHVEGKGVGASLGCHVEGKGDGASLGCHVEGKGDGGNVIVDCSRVEKSRGSEGTKILR